MGTKKDYLIIVFFSFVIFCFSIYNYTIDDSKDFNSIKGVYSSIDYFKRTTHTSSKIKLNLKDRSFIIPTFLEGGFKYKKFKREVLKGDSLTCFIDADKMLVQIECDGENYLEEEKKESLIESEKKATLALSVLFFLFFIYSVFKLFRV